MTAELIEGSGGVFDVSADGEIVFSKFKEGRHAEPMEIVEKLRRLAG